MTTLVKKLSEPTTPPRHWKSFLAFVFEKIGENINDTVVTIAALGILLSYLLITNPIAAIEYGGYIVAIYMLILFRRIVHDFDESYTVDEVGARTEIIYTIVKEIFRRQRDEGALSDSDLEERFDSLL